MGDDRRQRRVVWISRIGVWLLRALGATWRIRVTYDEGLRGRRAEGKPVIFCLWHGQLLPLLYHHRREHIAVLISEHSDGEIVARMAKSLGYNTVRGSTSRGAARALLGLARTVGDGNDLAITPDGPRGPAHSVAPGTLIIAQRSGAPVLPIAAASSSAWRLRSWDRFLIPKPFAKVHIAYGDLTYIDAADARTAAADVSPLVAAMTQAETRAGV